VVVTPDMDININQIRELADLAIDKNLAELVVADGDKSVTIKLPGYNMPAVIHTTGAQPVVYSPPAPGPIAEITSVSSHEAAPAAAAPHTEEHLFKITSPMVGTFYSAPSPDSPSFVQVGQTVSKGQTVCIIEAMKMMNELESEITGKVVRVLIENGQPVEFGQVLILVDPS
jgi:acetyl-CoA carboxylase biotin carboxyl carrier protein